MQAKNILLLGKPGTGKTTVIRRVVGLLGRASTSGFYTEEMREANRRVGFSVETLDGQKTVLAHVTIRSAHRVGKYGVNLEALERLAVPAIDPLQTASKLLVIDEIGKMECLSPSFREAVLRALTSDRFVLGTVPAKGNSFIREIACRGDVELVEVTAKNRNSLASGLARKIELGAKI